MLRNYLVLTSIYFLFFVSILHAQSGIIKGKITNKLTNEPIGFATVVIPEINKGVTSDESGNYEITGLSPGLYNVSASYLGFKDGSVFEIQVTNARPAQVDFQLEESIEELTEVVVQASPFKKTEESPVSLRTIGVAEIQRNPGGARDISRVIQSLPGVTTTASFRNDLIIRGGAPNENRFFFRRCGSTKYQSLRYSGCIGRPCWAY